MKETVCMVAGGGEQVGRCRVSRYGSWRNSRANWPHTRGMNRRQLDGDACFWPRARGRWRRCSSARKQIDLRQSSEGFWLFKTAFDFFYKMETYMIWALKLEQTQTVEEELVPYRNIFWEMKKFKKSEAGWSTFMYGRNEHNIVKQLSSNYK